MKDYKKIAIIGLGYVGLPLGLQFARSGVNVLGIDLDPSKVESINNGDSYIKHISSKSIQSQIKNGQLEATEDFQRIGEVDAVLICVPTPLGKNNEPDISFVLETARSIAPYMKAGVLIVLESTTYPGTTDTDLRKILEEGSDLTAGTDFHLAYSPEREDPGNPDSDVARIPKVVGGYTSACQLKAKELYSNAVEKVVSVSSCRTAEAAKLLENIFRSVNIALVNELKGVYAAMGIDVWEVIEAAKTKPFGYMPFYPGPGLGGHCIPIDPFYLTWKAREYGQYTHFIELAGEINTAMPRRVVDCVSEALNSHGKPLNGSKVLIIGLAYKANVDDDRESPSYALMEILNKFKAKIAYYDPHIPKIRPTREYSQWKDMLSVEWSKENLMNFDAILISTNHNGINYQELIDWVPLIIDTRNALAGYPTKPGQLWKA
ncbi:MAG: UDP-N-acetyl-D-glucosamine dehydrogenase [Rhodopirellula sp.]|nr:UDP-N-acetyl-D-glucosamine dehydrogenase [Rhodopirellula sp.]